MYVPQHKQELVQWLTHHYGVNRFKGWNKARLYACYFETRRRCNK